MKKGDPWPRSSDVHQHRMCFMGDCTPSPLPPVATTNSPLPPLFDRNRITMYFPHPPLLICKRTTTTFTLPPLSICNKMTNNPSLPPLFTWNRTIMMMIFS
ncbi:hypothetical protein BDQ17DRAFT_1370895 [Cyathus striatus]|nr:hypothetical protein BDQ17DRAFT_1370895 [Cyathus striatus]